MIVITTKAYDQWLRRSGKWIDGMSATCQRGRIMTAAENSRAPTESETDAISLWLGTLKHGDFLVNDQEGVAFVLSYEGDRAIIVSIIPLAAAVQQRIEIRRARKVQRLIACENRRRKYRGENWRPRSKA